MSCLTLTKPITAFKTIPSLKASVLSLVVEIKQILSLDLLAFIMTLLHETGKSWMNIRQTTETDKGSILVYMHEDTLGRYIYHFEVYLEVCSIITLYLF
jgi:hypothetical protein